MSIELRDGNIKGEFPPLGERNEDTLGNIPDPQIDPPRTIHLSTSLKYGNLTSKVLTIRRFHIFPKIIDVFREGSRYE